MTLTSPTFHVQSYQFLPKWLLNISFSSLYLYYYCLVDVIFLSLRVWWLQADFPVSSFVPLSSISKSKIDYILSLFQTLQIGYSLPREIFFPLSLQVTHFLVPTSVTAPPYFYSLFYLFLFFPFWTWHDCFYKPVSNSPYSLNSQCRESEAQDLAGCEGWVARE